MDRAGGALDKPDNLFNDERGPAHQGQTTGPAGHEIFEPLRTSQSTTIMSYVDRSQSPRIMLEPSEAHVMHAASRIYAAYLTAGRVPAGEEAAFIKRAVEEAAYLAQLTDQFVISDSELG